MKVFFASDHAGFALKGALIEFVRSLGHEAEDKGAYALDPDDDYPDFITPCARAVASDATARGIIIGRSGQGEAMAANRIPGVRAAVFYTPVPCRDVKRPDMENGDIVRLVREHNDANILALGTRFITPEEAKEAVRTFLATPFSAAPRHVRRLAKF